MQNVDAASVLPGADKRSVLGLTLPSTYQLRVVLST